MNKRLYGMAPGGRMALDKAANRRHNIWQAQRQARARERKWADDRKTADAVDGLKEFAKTAGETAEDLRRLAVAFARKGG